MGSPDGSGGGVAPGGGLAPGGGGRREPGGGGSRGGGERPGQRNADLDALAPLPDKPSLFPPNSIYYRVPITFKVEILDPSQKPPATGQSADRGRAGEEEQA
jgi:hypothetical protein